MFTRAMGPQVNSHRWRGWTPRAPGCSVVLCAALPQLIPPFPALHSCCPLLVRERVASPGCRAAVVLPTTRRGTAWGMGTATEPPPQASGRTLLGCPAYCDFQFHDSKDGFGPSVVRPDPRTAGHARPARPADRELRLAARQRALAGAGGRGQGRRPRRDQRSLRPRGHLRGDLPDRGLRGDHEPVVPRPPVRGGQVLHRRVPRARHDLRRAAVRDRRVHEQHDR